MHRLSLAAIEKGGGMLWGKSSKIIPIITDSNSPESKLNMSDLGSPGNSSLGDDSTDIARSLFSQASRDTAASAVGITAAHQAYFAKLAKEHHLILLWRPVNSKAAGKLAENYMGKRLNLKSKSSEFGPIAGDIPSNPRLGKAVFLEGEKIDYLDAVNRSLIEYTAGESDSAVRDAVAVLKTEREKQDKVAKLNDAYRVTEVDKYVDDVLLCYATDSVGNILTSKPNSDTREAKIPRFFKRINENEYQEYNYETGIFEGQTYHVANVAISIDQNSQPFQEGASFQTVKILAYKRFKYDAAKGCVIEDRPITADYDELACCPRNDYPFYNNSQVRTQITESLYKALATPGSLTEEKKVEIVAELMIEHDNTKYAEEQALVDRISMGYMTDHEHALKTVENIDTEGATNHGPEVYNFYYTEAFSTKPEDIYFAHLSDGNTEIFKNDIASTAEQKICAFINKWRTEGYPIPVNPCWGWEINEQGELTTEGSQERAKEWLEIIHDLQSLEKDIEKIGYSAEEIFRKFLIPSTVEMRVLLSDFGRKFSSQQAPDLGSYSEDHKGLLQSIIDADVVTTISGIIDQHESQKRVFSYQRTLIQLQLQIERIRLGANLSYSGSSLTGDEGRSYTEDEKRLNMQVNNYITDHVHSIKQTRISLLKNLQIRPYLELKKIQQEAFILELIDQHVILKVKELTAGKSQNNSHISQLSIKL